MKFTCVTIAAVILGLILSKSILTDFNPEFQFWQSCIEKKRVELKALQEKNDQIVLFVGGSSCSFSVNPLVIEQDSGIVSYNFGGAVPMGASYLLAMGFQAARSGDIIVLALEPVFLTTSESAENKPLGISLAGHDENCGIQTQSPTWDELLLKRRPGAQFISTFLGKKVMNLKGYRYTMNDFQAGGLLQTDYRDGWKKPSSATLPSALSEDGVVLLELAVAEARERGVKLFYSLPWTLTDPAVQKRNRASNQKLLQAISEYVTVLYDPFLGVATSEDFFGDSGNHLTELGAKERSQIIAQSLLSVGVTPPFKK